MEKLMYIYSILDVTSGEYGQLITFPNDSVAKRNITLFALDTDTVIGQFPKDFKLFRVGRFDTSSGTVVDETLDCLGSIYELSQLND